MRISAKEMKCKVWNVFNILLAIILEILKIVYKPLLPRCTILSSPSISLGNYLYMWIIGFSCVCVYVCVCLILSLSCLDHFNIVLTLLGYKKFKNSFDPRHNPAPTCFSLFANSLPPSLGSNHISLLLLWMCQAPSIFNLHSIIFSF